MACELWGNIQEIKYERGNLGNIGRPSQSTWPPWYAKVLKSQKGGRSPQMTTLKASSMAFGPNNIFLDMIICDNGK